MTNNANNSNIDNIEQNQTSADERNSQGRLVKCTVEIDGRSYRLQGDGSVEELKYIGQLVNHKVEQWKKSGIYMERNKIYLTTALELAEDYVRLWQAYDGLRHENESLKKMLAEQQKKETAAKKRKQSKHEPKPETKQEELQETKSKSQDKAE
mgnify:CR=1 FL=1